MPGYATSRNTINNGCINAKKCITRTEVEDTFQVKFRKNDP
jgi:hypothetical protein